MMTPHANQIGIGKYGKKSMTEILGPEKKSNKERIPI